MSTRAIISYPYRNGYKGAWVWTDGMPSHMKPILKAVANTSEKARLLVKFGNISSFMTKAQLNSFCKSFPNTEYIHCRPFDTRAQLEKFLSNNEQYRGYLVKELRSGLCLLTDRVIANAGQQNIDAYNRSNLYFVTEVAKDIFILQQLHHINYKETDDVNFMYYKDVSDMLSCDINHVYVFNDEKGVWCLRNG